MLPPDRRSVVVGNFDVIDTVFLPNEAHTPLIVDAYAVLSLAIARQSLQAVPRRSAKRFQRCRTVKLLKFSLGNAREMPEAFNPFAGEQMRGVPVGEGNDHRDMVYRLPVSGKPIVRCRSMSTPCPVGKDLAKSECAYNSLKNNRVSRRTLLKIRFWQQSVGSIHLSRHQPISRTTQDSRVGRHRMTTGAARAATAISSNYCGRAKTVSWPPSSVYLARSRYPPTAPRPSVSFSRPAASPMPAQPPIPESTPMYCLPL